MIQKTHRCLFLFLVIILSYGQASFAQEAEETTKKEKKEDPEAQRKEILKMRKKALKELYKLSETAKSEIASANAYAVFGSTGMNLFLLSTGRGGGVAHHKASAKDTYMKMISGGVGLGLGVKKYYAIFIFNSEEAFTSFLTEGWGAETQADAAAKTEDEGVAVAASISVAPDIMLYQITDKGLAAQATIQGTKYYVDEELNSGQ